MRRIIKKLPVFCIIVLILTMSFHWGENSSPATVENQISQQETYAEEQKTELPVNADEEKTQKTENSVHVKQNEPEKEISPEKTAPPEKKAAVPEKNVEQETVHVAEKPACSFSISCATVLANIDRLAAEKQSLIPPDGALYTKENVSFNENDTVFDVLLREMTAAGIHMEFVKTPLYGNVYIEGIGNLYEFDCGELSGWMYRVNGVFPNYGCDGYKLSPGDKVEWVYTCNLGRDVGGDYFAQIGE